MNKVALTLFGFLMVSPALAEGIDQTQDADAKGQVEIFNLAGDIEIVGWNRKQIQVTGELGSDVEEFIFERSGKSTTIKVKVPDRSHGRKNVTSELFIRVPAGSSIDVSGVSTDITVEGVQGEQDLQTVSGDIETEVFSADVDVETVSGDVDAGGSNKIGEARLETVSGDVMAEGLSGDIKAGTVSGDVEILEGDFDRAELETVNGDINFDGALRPDGKLEIETVNGDVDVSFAGNVSARFDIETFNGRIRNCFGPDATRTSKYAPGWELNFTEGSGEGRVTIATLNGGVRVCKD
jgi:DUF4097 and DUF4098 domain-containing protein YvlB